MKVYNFEEMVEKFGITYTYNTDFNDKNKVTVSQIFKGFNNNSNGDYETPEKAFNTYISNKKEDREREIKNLEALLSQLGFFAKIFNRTNIKNAEEKLEKWKNTPFNSNDVKITHKEINKESLYEVTMPELKVGDKVYVAVVSKNVVDEGVYEQEIKDVSYHLTPSSYDETYEEQQISKTYLLGMSYTASTADNILNNRLTKKMDVEVETEFHNGYTYHYTFINKEKAVALFNEKMLEKIAFYQSKLIK